MNKTKQIRRCRKDLNTFNLLALFFCFENSIDYSIDIYVYINLICYCYLYLYLFRLFSFEMET